MYRYFDTAIRSSIKLGSTRIIRHHVLVSTFSLTRSYNPLAEIYISLLSSTHEPLLSIAHLDPSKPQPTAGLIQLRRHSQWFSP
jgi:hypothetical protein